MRAVTLSDPAMAELVDRNFVCAWERKGSVVVYRVRDEPGSTVKAGGNIVSYVCRPDGGVVHAIPGYVDSETFLKELERAAEIANEADLRERHRREADDTSNIFHHVHAILAARLPARIDEVERELFTALTGQPYAPETPVSIRDVDREDFEQLTVFRG